jgi:hypothetical protein
MASQPTGRRAERALMARQKNHERSALDAQVAALIPE